MQVDATEVLPLELEGFLLTTMAAVLSEARDAVASIGGASVEDNKYSVSVHFRNCAHTAWPTVRTCYYHHLLVRHHSTLRGLSCALAAAVVLQLWHGSTTLCVTHAVCTCLLLHTACTLCAPARAAQTTSETLQHEIRNLRIQKRVQVRAAVDAIAAAHPDVHVTRGRKVLELRPQVAWDKGRALLHLVEALGVSGDSDVVPVYIGDDRTDEDAFRVLQGWGLGVLVSTVAKASVATYTLEDPQEARIPAYVLA